MKISITAILIAFFSLCLFSCNKTDPATNTATSTQWTIDGTTHKGIATYFITTDLFSADSVSNTIHVYFSTLPPANGTYTVTALPPGSGQCIVGADLVNSDSYTSVGVPGDKVTVTVTGNKITAGFSNITISDGTTTKKVSGTIVQNN